MAEGEIIVDVMLDHNDEYIYDSRDIWNVIREIPTEDELKEYYKEYLEECLWDRIDTEVAICREAVENGKEGKVAGYTFTPVNNTAKSKKSSRKPTMKSSYGVLTDELMKEVYSILVNEFGLSEDYASEDDACSYLVDLSEEDLEEMTPREMAEWLLQTWEEYEYEDGMYRSGGRRYTKSRRAGKSRARKSVGDSFEDEDGTISYVSDGGWNWKFKPTSNGRYDVIFLNGGFIGGDEEYIKTVGSVRTACDLADKMGILFSQYS